MRRAISLTAAAAAAVALAVSSGASAQEIIEDIISIPVDSVLRASPGSVTEIASAPVPEEFQGSDCIAEVESINQDSVHENNDLIIASGNTSGEVDDFESEAFAESGAEIPLTLGETVTVALRMGPDAVSSGGVLVTIDCTQTSDTTTTEPATTTTEPATTTTVGNLVPTPTTTIVGNLVPTPTTTIVGNLVPTPTTTIVGNLVPPPTTTIVASRPVTELPATGSNARLAAFAALTLASGVMLATLARRRRTIES